MDTVNAPQLRQGVSLVEVLVVVAIIGLLAALLFPAIQSTRESARRSSCTNNVRQIGIAVELHESAKGFFPSSFRSPSDAGVPSGSTDGWSAHVMLLPFLEEQVTQDRIDLNGTFDENFAPVVNVKEGARPISAVRVPVYLCPSEARDQVRFEDGQPRHYPLNYGVNLGVWFVFDPATERGGSGSFYPNSELQPQHFSDGLSKTLMLAEVKAWQPYFRNAAIEGELPVPASPEQLGQYAGPEFKTESGHTEWVDGRAHQTGFTTTFLPNEKVTCVHEGESYDIDWTNQQEGKSSSIQTFAAVTARSYHPDVVIAGMMDGSVRTVANSISLEIWRAQSTRNKSD